MMNIHDAAKEGDAKAIKELLDGGTDVNARDEDNNTPLCIVADEARSLSYDRELVVLLE